MSEQRKNCGCASNDQLRLLIRALGKYLESNNKSGEFKNAWYELLTTYQSIKSIYEIETREYKNVRN